MKKKLVLGALCVSVILTTGIGASAVSYTHLIANASPNLCLGIWGYEEDMPDELKYKC